MEEVGPQAPELDQLAMAAGSGEMEGLSSRPERFINRELSWLEFNRRVMEAQLFEQRMVRIASLFHDAPVEFQP